MAVAVATSKNPNWVRGNGEETKAILRHVRIGEERLQGGEFGAHARAAMVAGGRLQLREHGAEAKLTRVGMAQVRRDGDCEVGMPYQSVEGRMRPSLVSDGVRRPKRGGQLGARLRAA